ncbi:hypothetical protein ACFWNE_06360 [Streptomyces goshikiensis]|uniref:hypothetical protein n=1 Tax=Streptomyces goshikiensis TaxID=1942 RepID=UPI0036628B88
MSSRPTRAQRAAITQRRSDAIDLKFAGIDLLTIGRKFAAEPAISRPSTEPFASSSAAAISSNRAVRTEVSGPDGGVVQVETAGLEELQRLIALEGDAGEGSEA